MGSPHGRAKKDRDTQIQLHTSRWCLGLGPLKPQPLHTMSFHHQLCGFPFLDAFEESHFHDIYNHWPRLGPTIITVYVMMVTLVMMNLLIARMGDTYNRISDSAELEWLLQRARVVRGMENELNDAEHEEIMNHFLVLDRVGKPCLQVKEVDHGYWRKSKNESSAGQA